MMWVLELGEHSFRQIKLFRRVPYELRKIRDQLLSMQAPLTRNPIWLVRCVQERQYNKPNQQPWARRIQEKLDQMDGTPLDENHSLLVPPRVVFYPHRSPR